MTRKALRSASGCGVIAAALLAHCGGDGTSSVASTPDASVRASDAGADAWVAPDTGVPVDAGDPGPADITIAVHANDGVHPISPYVYGINDPSRAAELHAPIVRSGGNRLTAYNWENNASNAGRDYQYENDDFLCATAKCAAGNDTAGAYVKSVLDAATAAGAAALLTIPMVDVVAADKSPGGDVRGSGANYLMTRFRQNKAAKGTAFAYPPSTTDGAVYQDEMVHWLTTTTTNIPIHYLLDNEPDLWSSTHAEVHPKPVTYEELRTRSIAFATAIKAQAPASLVFGPVSYGWNGFVNLQNASDASGNGDFIEYYLDKMKEAEQAAGKRLVDGLDLHWYPEALGGTTRIIVPDDSPDLVAAREAAPRSLWDPSYVETSWIAKDGTKGPIALLPRMHAKIAQHYPGTKLSFSEWNYGGGGHVSGAIAAADVLGIFGRDGVDMAMMWPQNADESFNYAAFAAYRSYDGNGKAFGDTSVAAQVSDVARASAYASIASADPSRVVVIVVHKGLADATAGITIAHSVVYTKANVFTLTASGGAKVVPAASIAAVATNAFRYTMPAQSVSVLELVP